MNIERYSQEINEELMNLLFIADPDLQTIEKYLPNSTIFVAKESDIFVGIVVIISTGDQYELKNIAVHTSYQNRGIAKKLIFKAKEYAKNNGALTITVGTGNSSLSQLALYQKCGFRMKNIEKNFFLKYPEPIFENGIRCLDLVMLSAKL
ncbi:MAG: GNAT family N-acetyltransferase [Gammaproteobacteria bacterium]|nr:MAG: GNAT family N-acetyltransferase [Gammaproteobacteria bacterium]